MMKKGLLWLLLAVLLLTAAGCDSDLVIQSSYVRVSTVGEVPEDFAGIVGHSLLTDAYPAGENFLAVREDRVIWLDKFGNTLAVYPFAQGRRLFVPRESVIATSDGGILFARGFQDYYRSDAERWASEDGVVSQVIKLDAAGNVQWVAALEGVTGRMLKSCFETTDGYCFFGDMETPETNRLGVVSPTDISVLSIDRDGNVISQAVFGGSDDDTFYRAEKAENGYKLYVLSQSNDDVFENTLAEGETSSAWQLTISNQLELTDMKRIPFEELHAGHLLGYIDGEPVYADEPRVKANRAGTPTQVIDYGDMYLIVSRNITGVDDSTPAYTSMVYHFYETVYSAWQDGELQWRAVLEPVSERTGKTSEEPPN